MRKKRLLAAAAGVTAIAVIGGCAQQIKSLEPKLELRNAAQKLADEQQAGFTVKVTGSVDDLIAAAKKQAAADGDADIDADDTTALRTLFNSSLTIAYDKAGAGDEDDRSSLAATIDGVTGTEIRMVDKTLYAKAPVNELATKFGGSAADVNDIRSGLTGSTPALGSLFDGKWISLDMKALTDAAGKDAGLPTQDADAQKAAAELGTSAKNLVDGATIVRDSGDDKHLTVTTSTTKAYAELKRFATAVAGAKAGSITDEMGKAPKDRPIVLDLWIDNGKFTALEMNLLQFIDGATGRAALRVEVTTGAEITAPQDATKVDPKALSTLGASATTGMTGAAGAGGGDAKDQAELLGYDAQMQAMIKGGKPSSYLKKAIAELNGSTKATIVRKGVAEVTVGGEKACVKLPSTTDKDPVVTAGAC